MRRTVMAGAALTVLAAGACGSDAPSDACFEKGKSFEGEARLYIEHNATDQDTGFHGMFDQEGLAEGCIVTQEEHDDPHGLSRPVYDVHVPPDMTELPVPDEFFRPDTLYELEVLALEESGNQTITVGFFTTSS